MRNITPVPFRTNAVADGDVDQVTGTVFYIMPGVYNTTAARAARFMVFLAADGAEVAVGAQFSHDATNWPTTAADLGILDIYNGNGNWIGTNGRTVLGTL